METGFDSQTEVQVGMAELVDALGLGSSEFIRGGSSPLIDIDAAGNVRWYQITPPMPLNDAQTWGSLRS